MLYYRGYSKAVLCAVIEQMVKTFHLEFFSMLSDHSSYMPAGEEVFSCLKLQFKGHHYKGRLHALIKIPQNHVHENRLPVKRVSCTNQYFFYFDLEGYRLL